MRKPLRRGGLGEEVEGQLTDDDDDDDDDAIVMSQRQTWTFG